MFSERAPATTAWSVAALLLAVSDALNARFAAVAVRGELSGFTRAASGHCYFTLKDAQGAQASMRCAMFRRSAQMLAFAPRDGQQVELRGRLAVYEARGELQMVVEAMQPLGTGSLYEEFLRLKAMLAAQGLFDPARKRPLPSHPRCVAVVTSLAGAALHDVLTTLARRAPQVAVHVYPSLVQGAEAPAQLVAALGRAGRDPQAEAILLCRGGGSLEDLWAFNDERVVRAVAGSALPLLCGVGHETDVTLADLAADLRAATPTAAAELVAPAAAQLQADLVARAQGLQRRLRQQLDSAEQRLDLVSLRLQKPSRLLAAQGARLAVLEQRHRGLLQQGCVQAQQGLVQRATRWQRAGAQALAQEQQRLQWLAQRLQSLDPRQVLARGFAWVSDEAGQPVVSARAVQPGQALQAVWVDGEAAVRVESVGPRRA